MHEHPNATLVRKAYDAFNQADLAAIGDVLADDVVWHEPGRSVLAGDYKGGDQVLGLLRRLHDLSGETFAVELVDLLVDAERVTAFQRLTGQRGAATLDTVDVVDFEIHRGRVTEVTVYQSDTYAFDEFWA
jgi:ketosteroid isomerase-like protein